MRERSRPIPMLLAATAIACAAGAAGAAEHPEPAAAGLSAPRYATPEDCPRFAKPEFISRPLEKAYPGLEYNIRPAVRGGTYPYTFSLAKSPEGMKIDPARGTITWTAPKAEGVHDVAIAVTDAAGRKAGQAFTVKVTRAGFYFASPEGDDAAPGTIEKPWKTVERTAIPPEGFTYPAGAVVVFRGGEYKIDRPSTKPGASKLSGNGVPITDRSPKYWLAYPGEKPVIDLGWSGEKQKAAHAEQVASGKLPGGRKKPTTHRGYGHRFGLAGGSDYFYMDGFEIKNACYYMFVMWHGRNTVHFRRCEMHHLWCDWAENPGFIFTFAGSRRGGKTWGVRAKVTAYKNFVIQDNHFHDRFMVGSHGAAFTWYTVHDALIEDNLFERVGRGGNDACIQDKDNGLGNTYRGNVVRGDWHIISQGSSDEIEICHNYIEGTLKISGHAGWCRNVWVHHNSVKGMISFPWLTRHLPDKIDETKGDYSSAKSADSLKAVREFPAEKKFAHFYRNVLDANPEQRRAANVVVRIPHGKAFAEDWRYVRWDENLVDTGAKVGIRREHADYSFMKSAGFDKGGVQAPVELDSEGRLPEDSPYRGKYGPHDPRKM